MKTFFSSLLVLLIGIAVTLYLNRKSPELRYQLSSPIPIGGTEPKNVQQLEIANVGNAIAQKVQIQVQKRIADLQVIKDSEADTYKQFARGDGVELVYDSLPPGRTVKVIFTLAGTTLEPADVTIRHQEGEARPALSSAATPWYTIALNVFLLISMAFYLWSSFRHTGLDLLAFQCRYTASDFLKKGKPRYIKDNEWKAMRHEALSHAFDRPRIYEELTEWNGYRFLTSDRPPYITEDEWQELTKSLRSWMEEALDERLNQARTLHKIETIRLLFKATRPRAVPESLWLSIQKRMSDAYVDISLDIVLLGDRSKLSKALKEQRPVEVSENDWNAYITKVSKLFLIEVIVADKATEPPFTTEDGGPTVEHLQTYEFRRALHRMRMTTIPEVNTLNGAQEFLETKPPVWMDGSDYDRVKIKAEQTVALERDRKCYRGYQRVLGAILIGAALPKERPEEVPEEDWTRLIGLHDAAINTARTNITKALKLSEEETELTLQRSKVLRQLEVIDTFLKDPTVLDRIEDFEDVFAPGNFANLKELATQRRSGQPSPRI